VDWQALRQDVQKDIAIAIAGADVPQEKSPENTVLFIRNPDSDRAQHDLNIMAVLGTKGITIDGQFIPGLGMNVQTVDPGSADEADTYGFAPRSLILISETVSSGEVCHHADDPLPMICMESNLFKDRTGGMYFCSNSDSVDNMPRMAIVDAAHPITSVFGVGEIQFSKTPRGGILGTLEGNRAAGLAILAQNPQNQDQPCLALVDQGDTPLLNGGPQGYDPAPARRVCLGYQQNAFANPTIDGVILLQRTVQWALGDAVTAEAHK